MMSDFIFGILVWLMTFVSDDIIIKEDSEDNYVIEVWRGVR